MVFLFCSIAWVLFRADNLEQFIYIFKGISRGILNPELFFKSTVGITKSLLIQIMFSLSLLTAFDIISLKLDVLKWISERNICIQGIIYLMLALYIVFEMPTEVSGFIYFQF